MGIMISKSYQYFSEAIDLMVNSETLIQERVMDAYHTYIKHVSAEELPAEAQYLFKFFKRCMEPRILKGDIDSHDARQIAKVILFITDEVKKGQ